jgi:uncharacterized damage-inducible protein DinB
VSSERCHSGTAPSSSALEVTMKRLLRTYAFPLALAGCGAPVFTPVTAGAQGLMAEMHADVGSVEQKMIDLAKAVPENAYSWRPAPGVRSIGDVFKHVASDNCFIPIAMGTPAPAASGISGTDMKSVGAYEARPMTKDQIVAELEASFKHLHGAMRTTTDANLTQTIKFFGQDWSRQKAMILTVTHLHEHLGQAIAYARSNNVTPPWSK